MGLFERLQGRDGSAATATSELIDLTESGQPEAKPLSPRQKWGRPGPCPECGGDGFLDHIDMIDRIMYQHCTECLHKWQVSETQLATQAS